MLFRSMSITSMILKQHLNCNKNIFLILILKIKHFFIPSQKKIEDVDLVISNYAYSELNLELQNLYYENVIKNAKRVYMILNRGEVSRQVLLQRAEEDFEVAVEKVLDFWPPNGYLYYTTMVKK